MPRERFVPSSGTPSWSGAAASAAAEDRVSAAVAATVTIFLTKLFIKCNLL